MGDGMAFEAGLVFRSLTRFVSSGLWARIGWQTHLLANQLASKERRPQRLSQLIAVHRGVRRVTGQPLSEHTALWGWKDVDRVKILLRRKAGGTWGLSQ